jgi:hypothetical protein
MGLVRRDYLDNSERTIKELSENGRLSYVLGEEAKCIRERCIRVAAIIIETIEGSKNNCV